MTKWILVWVIGGQVTGASLPDVQEFYEQEACEAAASAIKRLGGARLAGATMTVDATCIEVPAELEGARRVTPEGR